MILPEHELEHIPPSEEVHAYPSVLRLMVVDFVSLFDECEDRERKVGLAMAINYCEEIMDDIYTCNAIATVSGMYGCTRLGPVKPLFRPRNF